MPSFLARATRLFVNQVVKRQLGPKVSIASQRKRLDALQRVIPMPNGVKEEECRLANIPARSYTPAMDSGAILYLHGGAYTIGSPVSHRELVARISRETEYKGYLIDYRLAPESLFPAAVEDALEAYIALLAEHQNIVVIGDSAGGGLTLALMQAIRAGEYAEPSALVLLSPWADLTCSGNSIERCANIDPMLSVEWLRTSAKIYAGDQSLSHPQISPLFSDFKEYPRTLIQVGTDEILLDDARRVAYAIKQAGNEVVLQEFADMWHVFQIHGSYMPESRGAIRAIANFLKAEK
ncbi:alpha/beta hydrolase [Thalassolituus sp.]|jgi:acetyl esterase/lipase|uniref:alpha/beta hydrolase n=1 Tax=Thalassolituus sp. TaxID=2030822 RepID=UPI002A7FD57A|nr:alpha/beta hydrolase [Thalassolituus sp.]|tara:strand:- start:165 stop:1046 length:882 start_codon:yes stop_codon:yes gene_type:complete